MKLLKYTIVVFCLVAGVISTQAQQDPQYTQYMFNGLAINPAYAGSRDVLSMVALYRNQWVGIEGAPNTTVFSIHSPIFDEQLGAGLQVTHDAIGINQQINITGNFSYWIPVNQNGGRLAFGLQGGISNYRANNDDLNLFNPNEENFALNVSSLKPNLGGGLYYYSDKLYVGFSTLKLIKNNHGNLDFSNFEQLRHMFTYAGYVFDLNKTWKFKPTILLKGVAGAPIEADLTAHFLYNDKLWLGASLRSLASFDLLAHYKINEELGIGYSYDLSTTKLREYNSGSHEILLRFEPSFGKNKTIRSPRYF